jgi:hypothetical protein
MKRTTLFAIGLIASTAAAGAAVADSPGQRGQHAGQGMSESYPGNMGNMGMGNMMQMMRMMHGQMTYGGMMDGTRGGFDNMVGGMRGGAFDTAFDTNSDGVVSPDEMRAGLAAQLTKYDADGNGVLTIAEFEKLNSDMIRNLMVDRFQALDEDGDGQITSDEMAAPAVRMENMSMMRARGADSANGRTPMGQGAGDGMGQNNMMNNDSN